MEKREFGKTADGREADLYILKNEKGMVLKVTDLGAAIVSLQVPDREGKLRDVVLGYDTPQEYLDNTCYFGAVIGRNGNRIDKARFSIGGKTYQMAVNDNENNLHSGPDGFDRRIWTLKETDDQKGQLTFALDSPDGDQGFPGNFRVQVTYTLTEEGGVRLTYEGEADQDTVANLTNHAYFNLAGHDSGSVEDQELMLEAPYYTPVRDYQAIPTGEIAPVKGTPMDFTKAKAIGRDIEADFEQLKHVGGYDHNFVLTGQPGEFRKIAEGCSKASGIVMEVYTDCPGVQFYAGNGISPQKGKDGAEYGKRQGFCLESQYFPNSINQEGFASPVLKAGEKYHTVTEYRFSAK